MFKKILAIFAFACVSNAFAQACLDDGSCISLDVIFRDFQAERKCPGSTMNLRDSVLSAACTPALTSYAGTYPGFQEFDYRRANKRCDTGATKGMVQETLDYNKCNPNNMIGETGDPQYIRGRYCARPMPASGKCYGENLHMWFTDSSHAKTKQDTIMLGRVGNSGDTYRIRCNSTNTCNGVSGYFPLDKYGRNASDSSWGFQGQSNNFGFTLSGSAEFKYDASASDNLVFLGDDDMWIFIDSKLVVDLGGVHQSVSDTINIQEYGKRNGWGDGSTHVINFFYAERQTSEANMTLTLSIDPNNLTPSQFGAPRIVRAETEVGEDGKSTTLLYIDKQIDMNVIKNYLEGGIDYGFPIVVWTNIPNGPVYGYRLESLKYTGRKDAKDGYIYEIIGEVCKDPKCRETQGLASGDSLSFNVKYDDFEGLRSIIDRGFALGANDDEKYIKNIIGNAQATTLSWGVNASNMPPLVLEPKKTDQKPVKPVFVINPGNNPAVDGPDKTVPGGSGGSVGTYIQMPKGNFPNIDMVWNPKGGTDGKGGMVKVRDVDGVDIYSTDVHGFGTIGKQIPPQRAGELILTAYPNATNVASYEKWLENYKSGSIVGNVDLFGLPPEATSKTDWWGLADPTVEAEGGGYQFVKNGFPNESSTKGSIKIAPTRCTSIIDQTSTTPGERASINCLNFSMPAKQPFQIAVTVYDQLGNFVTQYRETVTEQEFRNVTQAPNYVPGNNVKGTTDCKEAVPGNYGNPSTVTTNGLINVNVNIYPFSSTGRRFGNGVYIAKIDRVDIPFSGCQIQPGGQPSFNSMPFVRSHSEQKFGWMRAK